MAARAEKIARDEERKRREEERKQFKEAQELESLRRTFKRINKKNDGKICVPDLIEEMQFLGHSVTEKEAGVTIWEVDDDNDGAVDWDEFRTMFYRVRDDESSCEPRRMFNLIDFLMLDKNHSGSVDMDECITLLYSRYGRASVDHHIDAMKSENHPSLLSDVANEKNVNFTFYTEVNRRLKKEVIGTGMKPGATTVPQIKGLGFIDNPAMQHLS